MKMVGLADHFGQGRGIMCVCMLRQVPEYILRHNLTVQTCAGAGTTFPSTKYYKYAMMHFYSPSRTGWAGAKGMGLQVRLRQAAQRQGEADRRVFWRWGEAFMGREDEMGEDQRL